MEFCRTRLYFVSQIFSQVLFHSLRFVKYASKTPNVPSMGVSHPFEYPTSTLRYPNEEIPSYCLIVPGTNQNFMTPWCALLGVSVCLAAYLISLSDLRIAFIACKMCAKTMRTTTTTRQCSKIRTINFSLFFYVVSQ